MPWSLEGIGPDFIVETYASALLPHIQEYSASFFLNGFQRKAHLLAAIAAGTRKDISGEALAVDTDEDGPPRRRFRL